METSIKIIYESKVLSFKDFCLSEGIAPKEVNYGSNFPDFSDKKTYMPFTGITSTWFKTDYSLYWVWIDNKLGDVSFMKYNMPFTKDTESIIGQTYLSPKEYFMGDQKGSYGAMHVFSEIFYVILKLADIT
ncbi:MAG: hypothetical protein PHF21_03285 [Bacilli bacterium]|nr:hypothetical protein [Bacilli bacterium]